MNPEIVLALIEIGANPTSVLRRAVLNNDVQTVSTFLSSIKKINFDVLNDIAPTLYGASQNNYTEIMSLLLEAGVDPNIELLYRTYAIGGAAAAGHSDAVFLLMDHGVALSVYEAHLEEITTVILKHPDQAKKDKYIDIILENLEKLHRHKFPDNKRIPSDSLDKIDRVVSLIAEIRGLSKEDIIVTISNRNINIFQTLILNTRNVDGVALWWRIVNDYSIGGGKFTDMLNVMLDTKMITDVNIKNSDGNTALQIMVRRQNVRTSALEALLKNGADVSIKDSNGVMLINRNTQNLTVRNTLIKYGGVPQNWKNVWSNNLNIEEAQKMIALFEQAGTIDARDRRGRTMLHEIAQLKHRRLHDVIIPELIQKGIDPSIKDNSGNTALDIAKKNRSPAATEILEGLMASDNAAATSCNKSFK